MYRCEGSTCPLRKHRLSVQAQVIYCEFSSTASQSLGAYFFLGQKLNRFQRYCFLSFYVLYNRM